MNYSSLFRGFRKEAFSALQYKHLGIPFAIFAAIAAIPFWIVFGALIVVNYVNLFIFNCIASSTDYLEGWVKETKKDVHFVTEAVIYFVAMPYIFLTRCILSSFSVVFYLNWFVTMCFGYIASLGGIRWQPFISEAKFDSEYKLTATTNKTAGGIIAIIGFALYMMYSFFYFVAMIDYIYALYVVAYVFYSFYFLLMAVAVPIVFKKRIVCASADATSAAEESTSASDSVAAEDEFEEEFPEL